MEVLCFNKISYPMNNSNNMIPIYCDGRNFLFFFFSSIYLKDLLIPVARTSLLVAALCRIIILLWKKILCPSLRPRLNILSQFGINNETSTRYYKNFACVNRNFICFYLGNENKYECLTCFYEKLKSLMKCALPKV